MAEKTLNTRIKTRYDTLSNWQRTDVANQYANLVLLAGEVAICYIPASSSVAADGTAITTAPTVLTKVGDGTSTFAALPWASSLAADVFPWAKTETKPTYTIDEIENIEAVELDFTTNAVENSDAGFTVTMVSLTEDQFTSLTNYPKNYISIALPATETADQTTLLLERSSVTSIPFSDESGNSYTVKLYWYTTSTTFLSKYMSVASGSSNYGAEYSVVLMEDGSSTYQAALYIHNDETSSISLDFSAVEEITSGTDTYRYLESTDQSCAALLSTTNIDTVIKAIVPIIITDGTTSSTLTPELIFRRVNTGSTDSATMFGGVAYECHIDLIASNLSSSSTNYKNIPNGYSISVQQNSSSSGYTYIFYLRTNYAVDTSDIEASVATNTTNITTLQTDVSVIQNNYVTKTTTVNGYALSSNITLTASDVDAYSTTQVDEAIGAIPQYTLELNPETTTDDTYLTGIGVNGDNYKVLTPSEVSNINSTPTTFEWTTGTTEGPTGTLSGTNMTDISFGAIPSASGTQSGIITTDAQTIAGLKTFNNGATFVGTAAAAGLKTRGVSGLSSDGTTKDALWLNYDGNDNYSRKVYLGGFASGAIAVRADKVSGDSLGVTTSYDSTGLVTVSLDYATVKNDINDILGFEWYVEEDTTTA